MTIVCLRLDLTGESDSEMELDVDLKGLEEDYGNECKTDLGIESLLDDGAGGLGLVSDTKLSDAAALAESFQPKGNTLESTQVGS